MTKNEEEQPEEQTEKDPNPPACDDFRCPVQVFEEDGDDDPVISHAFKTKTGEIFYANHSLELEELLPSGDIGILVVIDAVDFPCDGDRSIITIAKDNIDYSHEFYHKESWGSLMRASFCTKCEAAVNSQGSHSGLYQ